MRNSKFMELSGTLLLRKERREKKGDKHRNPSPKQEEPGNPWRNRIPFLGKERREKKGDKHRNPSRKQDEPGNPWWNRSPFLRKKREKKGDKHRNPSPKQEEPENPWWNITLFLRKEPERRRETSTETPARMKRNQETHDETKPLSWGKKEERRRETSTGTKEERRKETSTRTPAGTRRNQQITMEQNPFPEERKKREEGRQATEPKKREEGRQAPEPQPEPGGSSTSWWNRPPFLRKERREEGRQAPEPKKREERRQAPEPQPEPGGTSKSWWNRTPVLKKEERRRETSTGTPAGTRRNQQIMMEQHPFPEERKKREEGRQTPEPQPEPRGTSKSWWNRTTFLRKERREKNQKGDKHRNSSRNQEEPANHDGTEPLSWGKKEERRRETRTGTPAGTKRNQQIMMEQNPFPEERKKREEGRQAPEPQPEPRGTSKSWWNRTPFLRKERKEKKGDKHRNPSRNQEEPANHDGTEPLSWGKKEKRRRETSTGTPAGTKRNQQIMMEQNPFPEERKKREEGRQAPEPQPEPRGTSKSWWNRTPFLRKERKEKKGDKHRNPSRNQEEPANHDGTEPLSWGKKEKRRETSTGTPAGTKRNQQIMMEQNPFPEERKKREEGRQAPEPQPEPRGTSKSWWNRTPFLRKERKEKKGDKHRNPSRNQEEPANHDGTEPLSWGKKEKRRRETSTGTPAGTKRNQQIMMEQNPFPEERKKREEGRQAPEPQPEPRGTSKSWWNRTPFLRKERKEKKGDKHRNPSRNQEEPANHEGTKAVSSKNWEPHSAQELFEEKN